MKVLGGLVLVAAIALVQGRNTPGLRVAEGTPAKIGENPHIVLIRFANNVGNIVTCAGSLIDNRWVLTTASCVQGVTFVWIRYGVAEASRPELVTESGTATITVHPQYDGENNNIALITPNRYVELTDNIKTIALATDSEDYAVGQTAVFCAWGNTEGSEGLSEELVCADLETADSVACTNSLMSADTIDNLICALGPATCTGDFGGPLVIRDGDNFKQIGILSFTPTQCVANAPFSGGFIRPDKYIDWIESVTSLSLTSRAAPENIVQQVQVAEAFETVQVANL